MAVQDVPNATGSSPAATQTPAETPSGPALIDTSQRTPAPPSPFTAHLNRTKENPSADASPASGGESSSTAAPAEPAEGTSADPADYSATQAAVDAAEGIPAQAPTEPATVAGLPNDPADDVPWHKDARFQQFLAERKAFEAQKAEIERLRAFAPLVEDLTKQGYADYGALQAKIAEQERQAEAARVQAEDAAYQQQLQQAAEARYVDEEDQTLFVQMQMEARTARREAEEAKRMAEESRQHYEATLAEQAQQRQMQAYQEIVSSDDIFTTYAKDPQTGRGLGEELLADYANSGASPQALKGIAANIALRLKSERDATIAAAKVEAAKGLKKSANAPAAVGTRGQSGGHAPATGQVPTLPPGAGFRAAPSFTKWLNKPSH